MSNSDYWRQGWNSFENKEPLNRNRPRAFQQGWQDAQEQEQEDRRREALNKIQTRCGLTYEEMELIFGC
jgi:hypothetical protein